MEKTITTINGKTLKQALVVDDMGNIYKNGVLVKPTVQSNHLSTNITFTDGVNKRFYIHQLVMYAFKGVMSSKKNNSAVHHVNGDKFDNRLINLKFTTVSDNLTTYLHSEAQGQSETIYDEARITDGVVTLKYKGILLPDYAINVAGQVMKFNKKTNQWKVLKQFIGNKKYPSNVVVNIQGHGVSLSQLMAENFMKIDKSRKFKVFQIDKGNGFENDFYIYNLRIAYKGDSQQVA